MNVYRHLYRHERGSQLKIGVLLDMPSEAKTSGNMSRNALLYHVLGGGRTWEPPQVCHAGNIHADVLLGIFFLSFQHYISEHNKVCESERRRSKANGQELLMPSINFTLRHCCPHYCGTFDPTAVAGLELFPVIKIHAALYMTCGILFDLCRPAANRTKTKYMFDQFPSRFPRQSECAYWENGVL
jgi:hypothetical protein